MQLKDIAGSNITPFGSVLLNIEKGRTKTFSFGMPIFTPVGQIGQPDEGGGWKTAYKKCIGTQNLLI